MVDRPALLFSAILVAASLAFAALPWRSMNSAATEGYAQTDDPQAVASGAESAALAICPGGAAPAFVATADIER